MLIPKETFDLVAAKFKKYCGVRTVRDLYYLKCEAINFEELERFYMVVRIRELRLKLERIFVKVGDNTVTCAFFTYPTYDGV